MKTIEERAKDYAPDAFDADLILPVREEYIVKMQRVAYISGATEQRKIDEDSFCPIMEESVLKAIEKQKKIMED